MNRCLLALAFGVAVALLAAATASAQDQPVAGERQIVRIRGDLYRAQDGDQVTVFLVTPDGIVLGDPLNTPFARWLRDELAARFPNRLVRYVLHTHANPLRAGGAGVFDPTADIIAHDDFNSQRTDQQILRAEDSYGSRRTITIGGRTVEIVHPGGGYGADMSVLLFPAERVVFTADTIPIRSLPSHLSPSSPVSALASVRAIEALDFDTVISGNGDTGSKDDVTAFREYLEELTAGVREGFEAGRSLSQLQGSLLLDKYQTWSNFASYRAANVTEAYRRLSVVTASLYAAAQTSHLRDGTYCADSGEPPCRDVGGVSPAFAAGVIVSAARLSFVAEASFNGRFAGQFGGPESPGQTRVDLAYRETIVSFLVRRDVIQNRRAIVSVGGGPAIIFWTAETIFTPAQRGNPPLLERGSDLRLTAGVDLVAFAGSPVSIVLPARLTVGSPDPFAYHFIGRWRGQAAVGLRFRVLRHVH